MFVLSHIFILMSIFFALSKSASSPLFKEYLRIMLLPFAYLAVSNILLVALAYTGARLLRVDGKSVITVLYAAPQKTITLGVPLLTTYFAHTPELLSVALLPLLFYHPWQLLIAGFLKGFPLIVKLQR